MADKDNKQQPGKHAQMAATRRQAKSADALRTNLMKRKQQTRARTQNEDNPKEND